LSDSTLSAIIVIDYSFLSYRNRNQLNWPKMKFSNVLTNKLTILFYFTRPTKVPGGHQVSWAWVVQRRI